MTTTAVIMFLASAMASTLTSLAVGLVRREHLAACAVSMRCLSMRACRCIRAPRTVRVLIAQTYIYPWKPTIPWVSSKARVF